MRQSQLQEHLRSPSVLLPHDVGPSTCWVPGGSWAALQMKNLALWSLNTWGSEQFQLGLAHVALPRARRELSSALSRNWFSNLSIEEPIRNAVVCSIVTNAHRYLPITSLPASNGFVAIIHRVQNSNKRSSVFLHCLAEYQCVRRAKKWMDRSGKDGVYPLQAQASAWSNDNR